MKTIVITIIFSVLTICTFAQSTTIDKFRKANTEEMGLFFYASTLQMLDNDETSEFYDMVSGIEKMRFLSYNTGRGGINPEVFRQLKSDIKKEKFDELMVVNHEGKRIIIFGRVEKGISHGAVALIEADESINIIDIAEPAKTQ